MTGCLDAEQLAVYVDSASLGSGDHARFTSHLEACEACRAVVVAMMRATGSELRATPDPDLVVQPGERVDRYAVVEPVGSGGMGTVYAAYDPRLDRKIALKLLKPTLCSARNRERMRREAHVLAKLAHPHVVAVHDAGPWNDRFFIAMEFVTGSTLRSWARAESRTGREIVDVLIQVADGLACAHEAGIVHRDVKPHNILVDAEGRARVGDFGLAGLVRDPDDRATLATELAAAASLTGTGVVLGTPGYMAPEQREGGEVGPAADQFSFCVTAYEALTGARPATPPAVVRGVPRPISRCLARGLAATPADRYPTMRELANALRGGRGRSHRLVMGIAAVAVVVSSAFALASASDGELVDPCPATDHLPPARNAAGLPRATVAVFDEFAASWQVARIDACRATRVFGYQSRALLDARLACLDGTRRRAAVLRDELARSATQPSAAVVEDALAGLGRCDELDALADAGDPGLDELAARAHAALVVNRPFAGLAVLATVPADAKLPPALRIELRVLAGELLSAAGRDAEAVHVLEDAIDLAEAAAHQRFKLRALLGAVRVTPDRDARDQWAGYAAATLEALGDRASRARLDRARFAGAIVGARHWIASRFDRTPEAR